MIYPFSLDYWKLDYLPSTAGEGEGIIMQLTVAVNPTGREKWNRKGSGRNEPPCIDWFAQLAIHIPGKNKQMVRYYGYHSNKSRGMGRQTDREDDVPALIDSDLSAK